MSKEIGRTTITAHAGCLGTADNTAESFAAALTYPVDYLEADVRFSADGRAYLSHDPLPEAEIQKAMSLDALLAMAATHPTARLNLDLKEYSALDAMVELVARRGMGDRIVLTGIETANMGAARASCSSLVYFLNASPSLPQRRTAAGAGALARKVAGYGAAGLNTYYRYATLNIARVLSEAGLLLSVWTVDSAEDIRASLAMGADNVTTRRIDLALALRDAIGEGKGGGR
jgi:glycerophosphoryl diester phosphodiesterase